MRKSAKRARAARHSRSAAPEPPVANVGPSAPASAFSAEEPPTLPSARAPLARVQVAELATVAVQATEFAERSRSSSTRRAYERQWGAFRDWCSSRGLPSLPAPPSAVALYLTAHADDWSPATLGQALSAIAHFHKRADLPTPTAFSVVTDVFDGIKRTKGVAPRRAQPLAPEQLRSMINALKPGLAGVRDRALLCLGLAAALRRSELVALDVEDLDFVDGGIAVLIRKSKTDQEAKGEAVGVAYGDDRVTCPVRAVRDWLEVAQITSGAIFRGVQGSLTDKRLLGKDVSLILKRAARRVDLSAERLSGHSLRAGLATTAAKRGKSLNAIAKQGRWKSMQTVSIYIRDVELFEDNASSGIGL